MTVSEFMFLAMGLVLGVASGVALIEIIRARPPARREVRLTVSKDAIPRRRGSTLSDDAFVTAGPEPARGGPADRREKDAADHGKATERRTNVLNTGQRGSQRTTSSKPTPSMVGMSISGGADPMLGALRAGSRDASQTLARSPQTGTPTAPPTGGATTVRGQASVALMDQPAPVEDAERAVAPPTFSGPCADERRQAHERCELATRAQAQAAAAAEALRRAQRAYDTHTAAAEAAADAANPRTVRTRKEDAQRRFRAASGAAGGPVAVEAAARTWLQEINQINREAAGASLTAEHERAAAAEIGARLERMSLESDAARVGAEMAHAACVAARAIVADCDERTAGGTTAARATSAPASSTEPGAADVAVDEVLGLALERGRAPRIFRLLRGDQEAMETLVARLSGGDQEEQRRWQLSLSALVDAIRADAIEQAYLLFPHEHPFWGPQTQQQNRDIITALASLGHRFDGLGGWVDDRLPTQRELSLALGYAGLDPMRVRNWPNAQQTTELLAQVEVAADEYLAGVAGELTLAEMVETLGRRADNLVELWNNWGRVRPLLLEER